MNEPDKPDANPQPELGDRMILRLAKYQLEKTGNLNNGTEWAPALVTRVYGHDIVNLRVECDGPATLWVTSADRGFGPGQWHDPRFEKPPLPRRSGTTMPILPSTSLVR